MRHDFLDRYSRLNSPIHRLPAGWKLAVAVGMVITIASVPVRFPLFFVLTAIAIVGIAAASRIPPGFIVRRLLMLEPLVIGVSLLALFQPDGVRLFTGLVVKSSLCLLTMILLSNSTPFSAMIRVLQRIGVPGLLVTTLALMYRYLFVLAEESQRMRRARLSRSFSGSRRSTWRSLSTVIGQLFIRASERAERIHAAMCARGWR